MARPSRHAPIRLHKYLSIHQTVLEHKRDAGAVVDDDLVERAMTTGVFRIHGYVYLRDRALRLKVTKYLELLDGARDPLVQTFQYSYHVTVDAGGNVFRYCSPHPAGSAPWHPHHHRHQYDAFGPDPNKEVGEPTIVHDWPTLADTVDEADAWYEANRDQVLALLDK